MPLFSSSNGHQVEYFVFGKGSKWIVAFHGFGQHANDFKIFEKYFGEEFKILSINLFHHGESRFNSSQSITKEDLKIIFEDLFNLIGISDFSIFAYSIGARVAFSLLELFPEKIKTLKLFAPDGLENNYWIKALNFTFFGQIIYKGFISGGDLIIPILNILKKSKLLDQKLYQFALINIENKQKRKFIQKVWMTYRNIFTDAKNIKITIEKNKINLDLYIGIYDKVIPAKKAKKFAKKIDSRLLKLHLIEAGHNLLNEKNLAKMFN